MVNMKVNVYFKKDVLRGNDSNEIRVELKEIVKDRYEEDDWLSINWIKVISHLSRSFINSILRIIFHKPLLLTWHLLVYPWWLLALMINWIIFSIVVSRVYTQSLLFSKVLFNNLKLIFLLWIVWSSSEETGYRLWSIASLVICYLSRRLPLPIFDLLGILLSGIRMIIIEFYVTIKSMRLSILAHP